MRDGVDIVVTIKFDGTVWSAWPLRGGRGVEHNPAWSSSPEERLLVRTMTDLPRRFSDRLDADDTDALRTMAEAAEWAEEIDLLVATLAAAGQPITSQERDELEELLTKLQVPAGQLDGIPAAGNST